MSLIDRRTKLKTRRAIRRKKRQVEAVTAQADDDFNRLLLRRYHRLVMVRRFVSVWVLFVFMIGFGAIWQVQGMNHFYLEKTPATGGVYREGVLGTFTNANPLFATGSVDTSVSRLIFSSLFKVSPNGDVVGDLAQDVVIDDSGQIYTVTLRDNVLWHDGEQFDSSDVLFTYRTIQDSDVRSPLFNSWRGVQVTAPDALTVVFELPNSFSSFNYSLTNGIVPEHILSELDAEDLRSSPFNTVQPVGTGPFTLQTLEVIGNDIDTRQEQLAFDVNEEYFGTKPLINGIVMQTYRTEDSMLSDFRDNSIQSMIGLNTIPDSIVDDEDVDTMSIPLTSSVMVFLNTSNDILSDVAVRRALAYGTDTKSIRDGLGFRAIPSDSPFLRSQFAYDPAITQFDTNTDKAVEELEAAGWVLNEDGLREKDGVILELRLVSQSLSEYSVITQKLQEEWGQLGIKVDAILQPEEDIQAGAIARHEYDVLLYGISIGYDPDVYAYWHSSQAKSGLLNLSEFSNSSADDALEGGRTRVDEALRTAKYKPFLEAWRSEVPAIALYQPRFLMIVQGTFDGFEMGQLSTASDRFWSVADWRIRLTETVK